MKTRKIKGKIVSVLLSAILISCEICFTPITAKADNNVLEISSYRELKEFANKVNNGNRYENYTVKLTNDIVFDNMVNNFTTIGTTYSFDGVFDGCGHSISGINIISPGTSYGSGSGLFGTVNGTIKNLTLRDCNFSVAGGYIGGIAESLNGTINNCHFIDGSVSSGDYIGGLVGKLYGTIVNSSTNAQITGGESNFIGGIVCRMYRNAKIYNSCNTGNIVSAYNRRGGLVGYQDGGEIQNCYNTGEADFGLVTEAYGIVSNSYCSKESSELNFDEMSGTEINCKAYPEAFMQTEEFLKILNDNTKNDSFRKWEFNQNTTITSFPMPMVTLQSQVIKTDKASVTYTHSQISKSNQSFDIGASAETELDYQVMSGGEYISVDFTGKVTVAQNTPKGIYEIQVIAAETPKYEKAVKTIKITVLGLKSQTIKTNVISKSYKVAKLKKSSQTFNIKASAKTKIRFKALNGRKYISVNSKGKVVIKKRTPKGTYKIQLTAAQSSKYKKAIRTIKIIIK